MVRKFLFVLLFLAVLGYGVEASAVVDVEARYWYTTLDSKVRVTQGSIVGTEVDLASDLGIDKNEFFPEVRFTLEGGKHSLRYAYTPLQWSAQSTLQRTVTYGGQSYTAGALVDTDFQATYHRIGYRYDIVNVMKNRVGVLFDIKYFDVDASLKAAGLGLDESYSVQAPIPTVGLSAGLSLPLIFGIEAEASGISLGSDKYLFDAEALVKLKPLPFINVAGGYRVLKLHVADKDDLVDLTLSGPFLMVRGDF